MKHPDAISAHTPGPWEAVGTGVYAETPNGCREIVFSQHNTRNGTEAERRANARLIAAAPDLFAALWEIKVSDLTSADAYDIARSAILKVTAEAKG